MYIPIFINFMRKEKDMGVFRRFVLPSLATVGAFFMICATIYAHGIQPYLKAKAEGNFAFPVLFYLIVFAVIVGAGILLRFVGRRMTKSDSAEQVSEE
jgi:APA family basic amino acid/polyamine antiporter